MAAKRTTITVPETLWVRLTRMSINLQTGKRQLNISAICSNALRAALDYEEYERPRLASLESSGL